MLLVQFGINLILAIAIIIVGRWLAKRAVAWAASTAKEQGLDPTVVGFLANVANIAILAMLAIAAISRLGVPTTSFIAIVGAAGLAIGLALQGSLTNFASGVLLVFIKPCEVGDYIESGNFSGTVSKIHIFNTVLLTPDKRTIIIPNTKLFNDTMINYSTSQLRRVDMTIAINYSADLVKAKQILRSVVDADERILKDPKTRIGVMQLGESSVDIAVWPWVQSRDWLAVKFDLNEKIKLALDDAGIEIPYPIMRVKMQNAQGVQA
ncbi:UNVERIFIED_CONTAM: hypothetical protein GTU68_053369 [Idotea baltica]|nr:hypothetical protein [Idotea baltica]